MIHARLVSFSLALFERTKKKWKTYVSVGSDIFTPNACKYDIRMYFCTVYSKHLNTHKQTHRATIYYSIVILFNIHGIFE